MSQQPSQPYGRQPYEPGHTHSYGPQQPQHQQGYGPATWTPPRPAKTGRPIRHLIGYPAAVLLALFVGIGIGGAGGTDGTETVTADPAAGETATASKAKPAATKAAAKTPGIGTPVRDGKFQFTVTKIKSGVDEVGGEYLNRQAQGQYVMVHVTVENIGDEARTFTSGSQVLFDTKGREYEADTAAGVYMEGDAKSFLEDINPGNSVKGVLVFDVPKSGFKPGKIELHDSAFSGGVEVALT